MSRRLLKKKLFPKLENKYKNVLITLLINKVLKNGKKELAKKIVYRALDILSDKTKLDPIFIFKQGVANVRPIIKVKKLSKQVIVGSLEYSNNSNINLDTPNKKHFTSIEANKSLEAYVYYNTFKSISIALKWIVESAKKRKKEISTSLALEILDSYSGGGSAIKKLNEHNKLVETGKINALKGSNRVEHKREKIYNYYINF